MLIVSAKAQRENHVLQRVRGEIFEVGNKVGGDNMGQIM